MTRFILAVAVFCAVFMPQALQAQNKKVYTAIEAGGMLGLNEHEQLGTSLNGYRFRLAVGRNFNDRYFLGFGLGNEVYLRRTAPLGASFNNRFSMLPLFADFRATLSEDVLRGELQAIASAGYAPRLGNDTFRGGLGNIGLSYGYPLSPERYGSTLNLGLGYALQQIVLPFQSSNLQQHSLMLTLSLFLK